MRRSWYSVPIAVSAALLIGCSSEDVAERIIEEQLESESGEDVDIDFDDGDISIQTEDGEFSIDVDTDDEGNVSVSGSGEDGDFTMESEDGQTVIETDEGSMVIGSSGDLPDGFPGSVPIPEGMAIQMTQAMDTGDGDTFILGGTVDGTPSEVADAYIAALEDAGFDQVQVTTAPDGAFFGYDDGEFAVNGGIGLEGSETDVSYVTLTVGPSQQN